MVLEEEVDSELETDAPAEPAVHPDDALEAMSLVTQALAEQQPEGGNGIADEPASELPKVKSAVDDVSEIEMTGGSGDHSERVEDLFAKLDQDMSAEIEIPQPVADEDQGADPRSAVADALEETLEAMAAGEALVVEKAATGKQRDIRALLERVEDAAKRTQDLGVDHLAGDVAEATESTDTEATAEQAEAVVEEEGDETSEPASAIG